MLVIESLNVCGKNYWRFFVNCVFTCVTHFLIAKKLLLFCDDHETYIFSQVVQCTNSSPPDPPENM